MAMHDGLPVSGYRPQSDERVDAVNSMKAAEERVLRLLDNLAKGGLCDPRWYAIGRTHVEQGFMAINRSVFQPSRAALPDDPSDKSA